MSQAQLLSNLNANGYHVTDKQLVRLLGPDEFDSELGLISEVCAYFEIASKRISDIMPMVFEVQFARGFGDELKGVLMLDLKLVGDSGSENCTKYTRDNEEVREKREELEEDRGILSEALKILSQYHRQ